MAYFDFDLEDALNGEGFVVNRMEVRPDGQEEDVQQKAVFFNPPQMGMFDALTVTKLADGTVWLDFLSRKYAPNKQLMDFIAHCTDRWGKDSCGQGYTTTRDTPLLKAGRFGRFWENVKITQIKREGSISLYIMMRIIIDNQDMSNFAKNLAKGFVRSAVNQVGRDGGRVISNNLYNGENYVPVAPATPVEAPVAATQSARSTVSGVPDTAISTTHPFSTKKMVWLTIASIFTMPIGSTIVFIYGLLMMLDRNDKVEWFTTSPEYVRDRRYKSGVRYVGNATTKHTAKVIASPEVMEIKKRNAKIAMIIGGIGILIIVLINLFA